MNKKKCEFFELAGRYLRVNKKSTVAPLADSSAKVASPNQRISHPSFGFIVFFEKILGKGEDGSPILFARNDLKVLAVFDGMGGAGSETLVVDGKEMTSAKLASELASRIVDSVIKDPLSNYANLPLLVKEKIVRQFQYFVQKLQSSKSGLRGSIVKKMPTTMALMLAQIEEEHINIKSVWAGDSRCYVFSPIDGLKQLTVDDLSEQGDAMENLKKDSPLSNHLHAGGDFYLNVSECVEKLPVILLSVSDGFFSYLRSPMHFEYLLLETLMQSKSLEEWKLAVERDVVGVTADDASMAVLIIDWVDLESVKKQFVKRFEFIKGRYIIPFDEAFQELEMNKLRLAKKEEEFKDLENSLWAEYQKKYYPNTREKRVL